MKRALFTIAASLSAFALHADEGEESKIVEPVELNEMHREGLTNPLIYDRYMTPYATSADLMTVHRTLQAGENALTGKKPSDSVGAGIGRFFELGLIWTPINVITTGAQYSLGARAYAKEHHISVKEIVDVSKKDLLLPRNFNRIKFFSDKLTPETRLGLSSAFFASGNIMQNRLAMDWVQNKGIEAREALSYILPSLMKLGLIQNIGKNDVVHKHRCRHLHSYELHRNDYNPAEDYVDALESTYGVETAYWQEGLPSDLVVELEGIKIRKSHLKDMSLLVLADPMYWFAEYSNLYYIVTGKSLELPMIPIGGGAKWLPSMGLDLTPSGPEIVSKHYIRTPNGNPMVLYGKYGTLVGHKHWGAGIEAPRVFVWGNNSAGFKFDIFENLTSCHVVYVAKDYLGKIHSQEYKYISKRPGVAFSLINSTEIGETGIGLFTQLGYKTKGYLAGESEKKGLIARGGLSFIF